MRFHFFVPLPRDGSVHNRAGHAIQSEIYLDGVLEKAGTTYDRFADFCLEPQRYPVSVNQQGVPSVMLRSGVLSVGDGAQVFDALGLFFQGR